MPSDPVYLEWKRRRPRFPVVAKCVERLHRRNVGDSLLDAVVGEPQSDAHAHTGELLDAFAAEPDERVRHILLGLSSEARLPEALPVYVAHLRSEDETLRYWSEHGLRLLDTRESRGALWEGTHIA